LNHPQAIPDVPEEIEEHIKRSEYIMSKVVDNIADDIPDEEFNSNEMIDLSVKLTDLVPSMDREAVDDAME
jgi:hypothetical protein